MSIPESSVPLKTLISPDILDKYVPANLEVMNPVCKGRYPCKGVGLQSHGLKSGDIIVGVEANDSFEELRQSPCALNS